MPGLFFFLINQGVIKIIIFISFSVMSQTSSSINPGGTKKVLYGEAPSEVQSFVLVYHF